MECMYVIMLWYIHVIPDYFVWSLWYGSWLWSSDTSDSLDHWMFMIWVWVKTQGLGEHRDESISSNHPMIRVANLWCECVKWWWMSTCWFVIVLISYIQNIPKSYRLAEDYAWCSEIVCSSWIDHLKTSSQATFSMCCFRSHLVESFWRALVCIHFWGRIW